MSCWHKTVVLRVPALCLGFETWGEWYAFLKEHKEQLHFDPGWFSCAMCEDYPWKEYDSLLPPSGRGYGDEDRLDMNLYPEKAMSIPGPFLDYCLEDDAPVPSERRTYNQDLCARPLEPEEIDQYLPLYQELIPGFTRDNMKDVHYCRYEWYDGAEPQYCY